MAQVKYHGEFPDGQDSIVQHGVEFERGKAVNVTDKAVLDRLKTNRFFEVSGESDKDEVKAGQEEAEQSEAETLRGWLSDRSVPYRSNATLESLRKARDDYEKAEAKAREE